MARTGGVQRLATLVNAPERYRLATPRVLRIRYLSDTHDTLYAAAIYLVAAASACLPARGQLEFWSTLVSRFSGVVDKVDTDSPRWDRRVSPNTTTLFRDNARRIRDGKYMGNFRTVSRTTDVLL